MKAEEYLKEKYNITAHKNPEWYGLEISKVMEEYADSKLQAVKEDIVKMKHVDATPFSWQAERNGAFDEIVNLITKIYNK